ncbi:hypothetical protein FRC11_011170, partial [Ceratobasidium sp. 423]
MPAPLRRRETLVQHPFHPPLTQAEYHAALKSLVPDCDPHELDIQLTAFYEWWKFELSTRDILDKQDHDHMAIAHILSPNGYGPPSDIKRSNPSNHLYHIVPAWMFDPDERRDKLQHLRCYRLRVITPEDDS